MNNTSMFRAFTLVGGWTMLSRILGFVRDMLMSRIIGASLVADAFNASFTLPNLFRRFLAEGAFNNAFLPQFHKKQGDHDAAQDFAQNSFASLLLILFVLISLIQIFMPFAILAVASGFAGDARFDMAQNFSRITIFYIAFLTIASLCSSILNSYEKFGLPPAAYASLNVILIATLIATQFFGVDAEGVGMWLSWGVFIAGFVQMFLVYRGVKALGFRFRFALPKWNKDLKKFFIVFLPLTAASGVGQINIVVGRQIASWTEGAMSWLNYADRLYQLPLGVVGVATGTVLLTALTQMQKSGDEVGARDRFNEAIFFSAFLTIPAAVALFAVPVVLVQVVFEGGAFDHNDTIATANAIRILAFALPPQVFLLSQMKLFFAREDTKTPLRFSIASMIVNVVVALALWRSLNYLAPAVGLAVSGWLTSLLYFLGSRRFGEASRITSGTRKRLMIVLIAAAIMGVFLVVVTSLFAPIFEARFLQWLALIGLVASAMIIYFGLVMLFLGMKPKEMLSGLRR